VVAISPHTTRATGTILTAVIYNGDHANHVANAQALNDGKIENVSGPVVPDQLIAWDGTSGSLIKSSGISFSTVVTLSGSQTLTNKTFALGNNTLSGTLAEFNTALTGADFATLAGAENLTNKTITDGRVVTQLIPNSDNAYALGTNSFRWSQVVSAFISSITGGTTARTRATNTNTANTTAKVSQAEFYGADTVGTDKEVAVVQAAPLDSNWVGSRLSIFTRNADTVAENARIERTATATHTALMIWDTDNATLERVTVGAAGSGGTGFKVLRIPN
jgi:hypothetical protein